MSGMFKVNFQVTAKDAVSFSLSHARVFGGPGAPPKRTSETIIEEGRRLFESAVEGIVFSIATDPGLISPLDTISAIGEISAIEDQDFKANVVEEVDLHLWESMIAYLGTRGPFSDKRFWLLVGDSTFAYKESIGNLVVGFPSLASSGNHGSIVAAFSDSISNYLAAGGPSTLIGFVEASGINVPASVRRFAFKKGMHVQGFPMGRQKDLVDDLKIVMDAMKGAKGSVEASKLSGLKFINQEAQVSIKNAPKLEGETEEEKNARLEKQRREMMKLKLAKTLAEMIKKVPNLGEEYLAGKKEIKDGQEDEVIKILKKTFASSQKKDLKDVTNADARIQLTTIRRQVDPNGTGFYSSQAAA